MGVDERPIPVPTPETRPFWDGCRNGELLLQHCSDCEHVQFPPRRYCSGCLSDQISWKRASGRGSVRSWTRVAVGAAPAFMTEGPFVMALIELDEGPTMLSGIRGFGAEQVKIGMRVEVEFEPRSEEMSIPYFHPLQDPSKPGP